MDGLEKHLAVLLAADAPPDRDVAFELAVMARIEQRRFRRDLLGNAAIASLAAAVLFVLAPALTPVLQNITGSLFVTLMVTLGALCAMQWSLREMDA